MRRCNEFGNGIGIWRGNNGVTDGVALIPQTSYDHDEDMGFFSMFSYEGCTILITKTFR